MARKNHAAVSYTHLDVYKRQPVAFVDERGTTVTAHGYLNETNTRGKRRKAVVDAVAATVILQNYLDYRRLHKPEI